jgi:uncharacterized membrane protein YphA (DoxX/SURF4 family)
MSIGTLVLLIGGIAVILTAIVALVFRAQKNLLVSYLQNFTGALFIVSGWVKAMDPLGTAYKMEQYFAEFESTFSSTSLDFIAPLFPWLSGFSIGFSVFMIIFEIILGIMLIIGSRPKLTAWLFFLLVVFFTILTGFTYLTGYVPMEANFFEFGKWVAFQETNMKVTDCGCFGDFIKLKPFTSFMKDIFLLIPAIIFIFASKSFHQLFTPTIRGAVVTIGTIGLIFYCMSNYVWDIPGTDFRPFQEGRDIAEQKQIEMDAAGSVEVIAYRLTNKESGEVREIEYNTFLKQIKDYPKEEWEYEQVKTEPEIEATKISDFEISDIDGNDVTDQILEHEGYHFMVVAHKIPNQVHTETITVPDTLFVVDTVRIEGTDSIQMVKRVDKVTQRQIQQSSYEFKEDYLKRYQEVVNPVLEAAEAAGIDVYATTGYADPGMIQEFRSASQSAYPFYVGDDILLKTIVRSNPGVVLWKEGTIVKKWHFKKLPDFNTIKETYIK